MRANRGWLSRTSVAITAQPSFPALPACLSSVPELPSSPCWLDKAEYNSASSPCICLRAYVDGHNQLYSATRPWPAQFLHPCTICPMHHRVMGGERAPPPQGNFWGRAHLPPAATQSAPPTGYHSSYNRQIRTKPNFSWNTFRKTSLGAYSLYLSYEILSYELTDNFI